MTDNTAGPTGQGSDPNPFSREGSSSDQGFGTEAGSSSTGNDQSGLGAHGSTPLVPGEPAPSTGSEYPAGDPSPSDQPPSRTPDQAGGYGQQNGPYGPPSPGYGSPSNDAYGQPAPSPYGQPGAGSPYGQAGANPPYEQPPAYDQGGTAYGYPQPGYGQPDYGQSGYGVNAYQAAGYPAYGMAPQQHPQAVAALITGILGLAICPPVGIAGLVLGGKVRREIDAEPQRYTGRGMGTAGFVLGILSVAYLVVLVLIVVLTTASGSF